MKWKITGYVTIALVITWAAVAIRIEVKDSRAEVLNSFGSAARVEMRLINNGSGLPCDAELRNSLMSVLRTLKPTEYPPRRHCSMVHFVARALNGQELEVLDLLTTSEDQGLFGMPSEQNYTSDSIPDLIRLMRIKHPELGLRFYNKKGRCE